MTDTGMDREESSAAGARSRPWALWIAIAALVIGAILRLYDLGAQPLWLDEATTHRRISYELSFLLQNVAVNDAHPPVYYVLLHFITMPLSFLPLDWALRLPSAAAGVLTLIVAWRIERRLLASQMIPVGTVLLAGSAFSIYYAQEARHYVFVALWLTLALAVVLRGLEEERPSRAMFLQYLVTAVLALYTFYYSLFFLAAHAAAVLASGRVTRDNWKRWASMFAAPLCVFALYTPIILAMKKRLVAAGAPMGYHVPAPAEIGRCIREMALGFNPATEQLSGWSGLVLVLLIATPILLLAIRWQKLSPTHRAFPVLVAVPLLCLVFFPFKPHTIESKHLFALAPLYFLAVSVCIYGDCGVRKAASLAGSRAGKFVMLIAAAVLVLNAAGLKHYFQDDFVKERWRDAAAHIESRLQLGDLIVPAPFHLEYPLELALEPEHRDQVNSVAELDSAVEAALQANRAPTIDYLTAPTIWLVEMYDSPVSYPDYPSIRTLEHLRQRGETVTFPGKLGTVRVTPFLKAEP